MNPSNNISAVNTVDDYMKNLTWEVKESASQGFSAQGLNGYLANQLIKRYWLEKIYDTEIQKCVLENRFHIHDLGSLTTYCCGWSLEDLIMKGFASANGNVCSKPARHFFVLLNQIVNFLYTLQGEAAGAQALSNFDTLCAPFVKKDHLTYNQVKKYMQSFIFHMNVPTRVGFQSPFTNLSFDIVCPKNMKEKCCAYNGEYLSDLCYGDCQNEMDMINQAFAETMIEGDAKHAIFSFPIPTYQLTDDFDFNDPKYEKIWEMTARYGIPYFTNFINSDLDPNDFRSMCPLQKDTLITLYINDKKEIITIEKAYEKYMNNKEYHQNNNLIEPLKNIYTLGVNSKVSVAGITQFTPTKLYKITLENGKDFIISAYHRQPLITYDKINNKILSKVSKLGNELTTEDYIPINPDFSDDTEFYKSNTITKNNLDYSKIKTIEKINNNDLIYCLNIDNNDHLFALSNGIITHNCRLRLDLKSVQKRNGGLFGATPLTGSVGVVTLNLPNYAYRSINKKIENSENIQDPNQNEENFYKELDYSIGVAIKSLKMKRQYIERLTEQNFYPYSKIYLEDIKNRYGSYWNNHFSTIGVLGMNEAINILYPEDNIITRKDFAEKVLNHIKEVLLNYQKEDKMLYNLEATPAESTSYRLAQNDNKIFGKNISYYTNSSIIPSDINCGLITNLKHQESLQTIYSGGTVFHTYLGEDIKWEQARDLVKLITTNYRIPYITLSPTFSICPIHKYLRGRHETCNVDGCHEKCNVYSRIVGYYRPVANWNKGKQEEFSKRALFDYDYSVFNGNTELIQEAESIKNFIYDYREITMINWHGNNEPASLIFTSGCNLKCPWCYNTELNKNIKKSDISLVKFLSIARKNIVITGGEPTIQKDLIKVLRLFKKLGFNVKLDTNGTNPEIIKQIIDEKLVSFISMDIKGTKEKYYDVTGKVMKDVYEKVNMTKEIIGNYPHEYRTTLINELTEKDVKDIEDYIKPDILTKQNYLDKF